jgi:threonylcarbamoyladenosine tRNA methylthiotransferase MtaB
MNRKYTSAEYDKGCRLLRAYFEHPAITTDVIVGFPGETEEEFETTRAFVENIHFYEMHIFKYSKRAGTKAAGMDNQVPENIKAKRSAQLIALSERMSKEFREAYVGSTQEVLFEEEVEINHNRYYVGYTKEYVKLAVKSETDISNQLRYCDVTGCLQDEIYFGTLRG